jgi:uncharacterized SAM-binding protein YcdF (DUF218 family)
MNALSNPNIKKVYDFLVQAEPDDKIPKCDAIFVFGTSNGDIAKHAASLYRKKRASRIIVSGLHGVGTNQGPSGFDSEAEYLTSIIEEEGVPKNYIILEPKASNTYENVIFGMKACEQASFYPKTLILVGTPYLLRRAIACFLKNFPEIKTYGSAMSVTDEFFTPHRIERMKGELPRLIKYAESGTIAPSIIPSDVTKAANLF